MSLMTDFNINGYEVFNECNHNDRGNPHSQYIGLNSSTLLNYEQGKYTRVAKIRTNSNFNFKFSVIKTHSSRPMQYVDCIFEVRGDNAEFLTLDWYGEVYNRVKVTKTVENDIKTYYFYLQNTANEKFFFQPYFLTKEYKNQNHSFEIINDVVSAIENPISCVNYMVNRETIVDGDIKPNTNATKSIGTNDKRFSEGWINLIRSSNIKPTTDRGGSLGESGLMYDKVYCNRVVLKASDDGTLWNVGINGSTGELWTSKIT